MKWSEILIILGSIQSALSDTEIINFSSELHTMDVAAAHLTARDWPILSKQNNSRILTIIPFPEKHEDSEPGTDGKTSVGPEGDLWVVLELDDWFRGADEKIRWEIAEHEERMFTVRLSWPASTPMDMTISLFPPISQQSITNSRTGQRTHPPIPPQAEGIMYNLEQRREYDQPLQESRLVTTSRRMYARVRASTGKFVRSPNVDGAVFPFQHALLPHWILPAPLQTLSDIGDPRNERFRFHIILEPLVLGVLPESMLSGAAFLLAVLLVAGLLVLPLVNAVLSKLATRARKGKGKWSD